MDAAAPLQRLENNLTGATAISAGHCPQLESITTMIVKKTFKRWTEADNARLYETCRHHLHISEWQWREIAKEFEGHTACACQCQYSVLKARAEGRDRIRHRRDPNAHYVQSVPKAALAQRREPLPEPASITAAVLGDPLPGRSALDRMRHKEIA